MVHLPAKPAPRMQPSKSFVAYFQFYLTRQNLVTWPCLAAKEAEKKKKNVVFYMNALLSQTKFKIF